MVFHETFAQLEGDFRLAGISSCFKYYGIDTNGIYLVEGNRPFHELAKAFPDIEFPGILGFDGIIRSDGCAIFYCEAEPRASRFEMFRFYFDLKRKVYRDTAGIYSSLRKREMLWPGYENVGMQDDDTLWLFYLETAIAAGLFGGVPATAAEFFHSHLPDVKPENQRLLLELVLSLDRCGQSLQFLKESGFLGRFWPELEVLDGIDHAKEYHPEGNGWEHTLETLSHRKRKDFQISLALLLHDCGKATAEEVGGNKFHDHAQLGVGIARCFLQRLGYRGSFAEGVLFLVKNHMLPGFVSSLPVSRTDRVMSDELFPKLLEVYRCDLLSTYEGPDGYYEACRAYKRYLKNRKNPFRSMEGKKFYRWFVD